MSAAPASFQNVLLEVRDGVAFVTINRPKQRNALDRQTIQELAACFTALSQDASVGAAVLTGAGEKAFVAGADVSMLAEQGVLEGKENARLGQALTELIERGPKPVLAAVNGYALGGGLELALACDFRYASENARLGLPEVSLGLIPGYGGTQRLPRLVGSGVALEMVLTGEPLDAREALRVGLVNRVLPQGDLLPAAEAAARTILSRGPVAVSLAKEAVRRGLRVPLEDGLRLEADLFGLVSATQDMREGTKAFLEKRKPDFQGR